MAHKYVFNRTYIFVSPAVTAGTLITHGYVRDLFNSSLPSGMDQVLNPMVLGLAV